MNRFMFWFVCMLLLGVHACLIFGASRRMSMTFDEVVHIPGGHAYWRKHDYRMQPENGVLPQRLIGLPGATLMDLTFPASDENWRKSNVWEVGDAFLYESGNDPLKLIRWSRAPITLLSVLLCLVIAVWSYRLWGMAGSLASLVLAVFSPTLLAHGGIASSDICAGLFFTLSLLAMSLLLQLWTPLRLLFLGFSIGGLFVSKFSAPILILVAVPLLSLFVIQQRAWPARSMRRTHEFHHTGRKLLVLLGSIAVVGVVTWAIIWSCFGWRFDAVPDDAQFEQFHKFPTVEETTEGMGISGRVIAGMYESRFLPEAFLYGAARTLRMLERQSFFAGEYRLGGFLLYFPFCFLVKSSVAVLLLMAIGLWRVTRWSSRRAQEPRFGWKRLSQDGRYDVLVIGLFAIVFSLTSLLSSLNIGQRHLLPLYPLLFVLLGGVVPKPPKTSLRTTIAVLILVGCHVAHTLWVFPNYLSYFNVMIPREKAHQWLVDSNLDWGQDLPGLVEELETLEAKPERTYLFYYGTARPESYGYAGAIVSQGLDIEADALQRIARGGYFCVSATTLSNVYGSYAGRWNNAYEGLWRNLLVASANDGPSNSNSQVAPEVLRKTLRRLTLIRFLRNLAQREPVAIAGDSIHIYELEAEEVEALCFGPALELEEEPPGYVVEQFQKRPAKSD